jgi:hypothetical protein
MNEELGPALREIADLLRLRVELAERSLQYQEERDKSQQEKAAGMFEKFKTTMPKLELPEFARDHDRFREEMKERERKMETRMEEERQRRRAFEERLICELERHNLLLEKILFHLDRRRGGRARSAKRDEGIEPLAVPPAGTDLT